MSSVERGVEYQSELRWDKEAAALVEVRNAVVAGRLWRKSLADTRLAVNKIQVGQCRGIFAMEWVNGWRGYFFFVFQARAIISWV
ncbi:MAG TPA: hypothetical protein VNZ64_04045 [Candidatus Acidoferrum sp.]|jgi:hypothetical protein|nr:hypothetical protein [Candidatus Acidoferrum sp.]